MDLGGDQVSGGRASKLTACTSYTHYKGPSRWHKPPGQKRVPCETNKSAKKIGAGELAHGELPEAGARSLSDICNPLRVKHLPENTLLEDSTQNSSAECVGKVTLVIVRASK